MIRFIKTIINLNNDINGKITVTANGTETCKQLLERLSALIDKSKITPRCTLCWYNFTAGSFVNNTFNSSWIFSVTTEIAFSNAYISGTNSCIFEPIISSNECRVVYLQNNARTEFTNNTATGYIEFMY